MLALAIWLALAQEQCVAKGACRICWEVSSAEQDVIRHRPQCSLPLGEQIPLIAEAMRKTLESGVYRRLSWGRLYPDPPRDAVLATRLALAAKRSPRWDAARGRPRSGDVNLFVRTLANEAPIYGELREMFRSAGLEIEIVSVEKVLVRPAGELPFFGQLSGVSASDLLPYDCITWFGIRKR